MVHRHLYSYGSECDEAGRQNGNSGKMVSRAITLNGGIRLQTHGSALASEDGGDSMIQLKVNGVERSFQRIRAAIKAAAMATEVS